MFYFGNVMIESCQNRATITACGSWQFSWAKRRYAGSLRCKRIMLSPGASVQCGVVRCGEATRRYAFFVLSDSVSHARCFGVPELSRPEQLLHLSKHFWKLLTFPRLFFICMRINKTMARLLSLLQSRNLSGRLIFFSGQRGTVGVGPENDKRQTR